MNLLVKCVGFENIYLWIIFILKVQAVIYLWEIYRPYAKAAIVKKVQRSTAPNKSLENRRENAGAFPPSQLQRWAISDAAY